MLNKRPEKKAITESFAFGCISGITTAILLQPFDRIKTLIQQENNKGIFLTTKRLIAHDGILSLWRGITPSLIRIVPGLSMYFSLIQTSKVYFINPTKSYENFAVGLICRSITALILHPTTVIKTKLESSYHQNQNMFTVTKIIFKERGVRGYFSGIIPTLLRDAPFSGLYLMFYRKNIEFFDGFKGEVTPAIRFSCGIVAGAIACVITQPFDVLKTTAQLYPKKYLSMLTAIKILYHESGTRSLLAGFIPRVLRRTLTSAMNWTIFDELQKHLQ